MKYIILSILFATSHLFASEDTLLINQLKEDMVGLAKIKNPAMAAEISKDQFEAAIQSAQERNPDLLAISAEDFKTLESGKYVFTEAQTKEMMQKVRSHASRLPRPGLLEYYESQSKEADLNPVQCFLAYRMSKLALHDLNTR